jgi:hypothetical protein
MTDHWEPTEKVLALAIGRAVLDDLNAQSAEVATTVFRFTRVHDEIIAENAQALPPELEAHRDEIAALWGIII